MTTPAAGAFTAALRRVFSMPSSRALVLSSSSRAELRRALGQDHPKVLLGGLQSVLLILPGWNMLGIGSVLVAAGWLMQLRGWRAARA